MTDYHEFFHQYLQFSRLFTKKLNEELSHYGLYHSQWMIVYYLKNVGPSTLVEISNYLNVEKPTVTRTVNRLENGHFIEQIEGKNKRERRIQLTEKGEKTYELCRKTVTEFEKSVMEEVSDIDFEKTYEFLLAIRKKIEE